MVHERVGGHYYSEEEFPVLEDTSRPMVAMPEVRRSTRANKGKTTKFDDFVQ